MSMALLPTPTCALQSPDCIQHVDLPGYVVCMMVMTPEFTWGTTRPPLNAGRGCPEVSRADRCQFRGLLDGEAFESKCGVRMDLLWDCHVGFSGPPSYDCREEWDHPRSWKRMTGYEAGAQPRTCKPPQILSRLAADSQRMQGFTWSDKLDKISSAQ